MTPMHASAVFSWMQHGRCARRPDLPWLVDRHRVDADDRATMAMLCAGCPVRATCCAFADQTKVKGGFWAGEHAEDRRERRDQERAA